MLSKPSMTIFLFLTFLHSVCCKFLNLFKMVKSDISKKQSKAFGSAGPIGFESTTKNQSPTITSSNFRAVFEDHPSYNEAILLMIKYLSSHPLFGAFNSFTNVVPLSTLLKCDFSTFHPNNNPQEVHLTLIDDSLVVLTKTKFLEAINLRVLPSTRIYSPSANDITSTLYQMGYQKKLKSIGEFKTNQLPTVWQYVCHFVIWSLSGRTGGIDNMWLHLLEILWSIFIGNAVNYGQILWDHFLWYLPKENPR